MDDNNTNGIPELILATAMDAAQDAKENLADFISHRLPNSDGTKGEYSNAQALCLATAIIMIFDSMCEASLQMAKNNPGHALVGSPVRMFDKVVAHKIKKLREIANANGG